MRIGPHKDFVRPCQALSTATAAPLRVNPRSPPDLIAHAGGTRAHHTTSRPDGIRSAGAPQNPWPLSETGHFSHLIALCHDVKMAAPTMSKAEETGTESISHLRRITSCSERDHWSAKIPNLLTLSIVVAGMSIGFGFFGPRCVHRGLRRLPHRHRLVGRDVSAELAGSPAFAIGPPPQAPLVIWPRRRRTLRCFSCTKTGTFGCLGSFYSAGVRVSDLGARSFAVWRFGARVCVCRGLHKMNQTRHVADSYIIK